MRGEREAPVVAPATWDEVEPLLAEAVERQVRRALARVPLPRWEA